MKLTKEDLAKIIKEELQDALKEGYTESDNPAHDQIYDMMMRVSNLIAENGSHPGLTEAYIALLRSAQAGGLNLKSLMMMI